MTTAIKPKEIRKQKRLERLGTDHPVCASCGENDWRCFEQHHIAGQAYHDDVCNVCCNCHRKLTDDQQDHPKQASMRLWVKLLLVVWFAGLAMVAPEKYKKAYLPDVPSVFPQSTATLLVGDKAVTETVEVPLNPREEFDGLTREEVLKKRLEKVQPFVGTLVQNYSPLNEIYGQIWIDKRGQKAELEILSLYPQANAGVCA
jgi:hypothetical protein